MISVSDREGDIVGKEYADYQQFLLFPQCFQMPSFAGPWLFLKRLIGIGGAFVDIG